MGAMQRTKGASGEREACALLRDLTGIEVRRRVRNQAGDSDLVGIPGWSVEVKRHASATPGVIDAWWAQAVAQGCLDVPLLLYRLDRQEWRARWPLSVVLTRKTAPLWTDAKWAADTTPEAWASVYREVRFGQLLEAF